MDRQKGAQVKVGFAVRFWARVAPMDTPGGCWEWIGIRNAGGYGKAWHGGKYRNGGRSVLAHRASWAMENGPIPEGLDVCHHCDNPPCVNPGHLFVGTTLDNMRDMRAKGRAPCVTGNANPAAKLTAADAVAIRREYALGGVRQVDLARKYGVGQAAISRVVLRQNWGAA